MKIKYAIAALLMLISHEAVAQGNTTGLVVASCGNQTFKAGNPGPFTVDLTGKVCVNLGSGVGTVTSVSVTTANGVSGVVANPTTTPAITLTLGAITPSSISTGGQITSTLAIGTAPLVITSTTLVPNLYVARALLADSATTNANLTGPITSVGNATSIASQTGTGTKFVVDTSPTLVTPNIGVATGTSLALNGATIGSNAISSIGQYASFGATTTGPGFYAYLNGDTLARVRIGLDANDMPSLAFGAGGASTRDTFILRAAAASLQFGQTDVDTAPVAQTTRTQGTLAGGTSNVAGANWTLIASPGKGTGVGGSFLFQTAPAGSTGTTVNAPVTALTIDSTQRATFSAGITNSGNGAASISQSLWNGTVLTGGTATTNFPAMFVQPSGTSAVTSWSTSGTGLGMNLASGFAGNFFDVHVAGGASMFSVTGAGLVSSAAGLTTGGNLSLTFTGALISLRGGGTLINSPASGTLQFGNVDAVSPTAQTTRVQSVVAGTAAANGANWTLIGSLPTGTGTSGDIILQTGVKTGSGTTQGTPTTALTIKGETQALVTAALDASTSAGGALQVAGGASVAKRFWLPAITTSSGLQTAVLCQSSGGEVIADSVACLASSARFKDIRGPLSSDIVGKFMKLPIKVWAYKEEGIFKKGNWTRDRIGPIAEDVENLDPRLVEYDNDGQVRAYSTEQLLAYTIKVVQEQQIQIDGLRARRR